MPTFRFFSSGLGISSMAPLSRPVEPSADTSILSGGERGSIADDPYCAIARLAGVVEGELPLAAAACSTC